ncbi:MAG: class I SAM-dependent RNA methyltransferase [Actinomycetota bacterium]|nr:class I SAM-dependent RNA methyltransferase [Actinomycetota bacterium]
MQMIRVRAESAAYGGFSIARGEAGNGRGEVVFLKGAIPGELVDADLVEKRKDYSVAVTTTVIEPSERRVEPVCPVFGICGGCQMQHIQHAFQVEMKSSIIADSLARLGGLDLQAVAASRQQPVSGGPLGYRRRAQLKVSPSGETGFFKEASREVIGVTDCPVLSPGLNDFLLKLSQFHPKGLKEIHLTEGDDGAIALLKGLDFDEAAGAAAMAMGFAGVHFADGSYLGRGHAVFGLPGIGEGGEAVKLKYTVSPTSFFQGNWELNVKAVEAVIEALSPLEGKSILDIYAGGGNFSLPLAGAAAKVMAVEENPSSAKDGARNVQINGLEKKVRFLNAVFEKAPLKGGLDIAIIDPPRPGLTKEAITKLAGLSPESVIYISCNPSTLARDLKRLSGKYELSSWRLLDFFPNTYHIETLCVLRRA